MSELTIIISGPVGSGKSAILGEIEILMRALGVPVRYADELAHREEVNSTHADWIDAIEMYKPSVVLAEQSAPRQAVPDGWLPIETAPKGVKVIAGYRNQLGKWRSVMARYYGPGTLELADDQVGDDDGFAPAGWYEETETHETTYLTVEVPTHWMPLAAAPSAGRMGVG